ncbi:hypothetical protein EHM69_08380 [candidate division KSB1 bacterium]|nr:MAG: hypothetical protein EHM69_08380 [candidate division KSB1 bacterium]
MSRYQTIDLDQVKTYSVTDRASKVERGGFASPIGKASTFSDFWDSLPDFLAARDLHEVVRTLSAARGRKPILWMMGAHPLKVGLSRLLIDLLKSGFISSLSSHGAFAVHDSEIAMFGKTSEEVADTIRDGRFGMARETGEFFVRAVNLAREKQFGLGEALGECLLSEQAPFVEDSLLAQCLNANVPLTIHAAIGTDIVYEHPHLSGAGVGEASYRDFLIFCKQVSGLCEGAAVLNFGSAVIMPEVFLKALAVARNLENPCHGFLTANFDMLQHYRPTQNVVRRPTATGGKGYSFTGHHEIMLPLLAAALRSSAGNG